MIKKFQVLAIATLFISTGAFATNNGARGGDATAVQGQDQGQAQGQLQGQGQAQSTVVGIGINNRIDNDVRTNAEAYAGALSASKSNADSTSNSGGNTLSINDSGERHYSGEYTVKSAPNVAAPSVYPTSPCMGGSSVGASGVAFGVSFGTSWTDDECGIRETARSFSGLGLEEDAVAVLCSSKYAAVAPVCQKK